MATLSEPDPRGPDPTRPLYVRYPWHVMAYIEQARIHRRHTQRKLAAMAGVQQPTYVGWANTGSMRGHRNAHAHMPRINNILNLLDVLDLDLVIRPRGHDDAGPVVVDPPIRRCAMCNEDICTCPVLPTPGHDHEQACEACKAVGCCEHCWEEAA